MAGEINQDAKILLSSMEKATGRLTGTAFSSVSYYLVVSLSTIITNKRVLEGWCGCKTKADRKRTLWACGPELRLGVNMGWNTPQPLYNNVLWQTSTWIMVITCSLQTLITEFVHKEPRGTLPVCGFLANSFLGKDGSWALHSHSTNSSLPPGWTWGWWECEDKEKAAWGWPQGSVGGVALSFWGWNVCLLHSEARYVVDCLLVALPCFFLRASTYLILSVPEKPW